MHIDDISIEPWMTPYICGVNRDTATKLNLFDWLTGNAAVPVNFRGHLAPVDGFLEAGRQLHETATGETLTSMEGVGLTRSKWGFKIVSTYDYWNESQKCLHQIVLESESDRGLYGTPGTGDVPSDVLVNALHRMAVWNAEAQAKGSVSKCMVTALFGTYSAATFVVEYDPVAVERLMEQEGAFVASLVSGKPPAPVTPADARSLWPRTNGTTVIASADALYAVQALKTLRQRALQVDDQKKQIETFVLNTMGEAAELIDPRNGHVIARWKNTEDTRRIDVARLRAERPDIVATYETDQPGARKLTLV